MQKFFESLLIEPVLLEAVPLFETLERHHIRSIRSNLRSNEALLKKVNNHEVSLAQLIALPVEDLANDEVKNVRRQEKIVNMKSAVYTAKKPSREELDVISNKIEDP